MSPTRTHASFDAAANAALELVEASLSEDGRDSEPSLSDDAHVTRAFAHDGPFDHDDGRDRDDRRGRRGRDGLPHRDDGTDDEHDAALASTGYGADDGECDDLDGGSSRSPENDLGVFQLASNQVLLTLSYSLASHVRQVARMEGVAPEDILIELIAEGVTKRAFQDVARPAPSHFMTRTGYVPPEANGNLAPQPALSHHSHLGGQGVAGYKGARNGAPGPFKNGNGNSFGGNAKSGGNHRGPGSSRGAGNGGNAGNAAYQGGQGYHAQSNVQRNRGHVPAQHAPGLAVHAPARDDASAGTGGAAGAYAGNAIAGAGAGARGYRGGRGSQAKGRVPYAGVQGNESQETGREGDDEE